MFCQLRRFLVTTPKGVISENANMGNKKAKSLKRTKEMKNHK